MKKPNKFEAFFIFLCGFTWILALRYLGGPRFATKISNFFYDVVYIDVWAHTSKSDKVECEQECSYHATKEHWPMAQFVWDSWVVHHPIIVTVHALCTATCFLMFPLQFWSGLRNAKPAVHVWMGRVAFILLVIGLVTSLPMAADFFTDDRVQPAGGYGFIFMAICTTITGGMGFYHAWQRSIQLHREWMTRCFSVMIWSYILFRFLFMWIVEPALVSAKVGWSINTWCMPIMGLLSAECWIQYRRHRMHQAPPADLAAIPAPLKAEEWHNNDYSFEETSGDLFYDVDESEDVWDAPGVLVLQRRERLGSSGLFLRFQRQECRGERAIEANIPLPPGSHYYISAHVNGAEVSRPYTPITSPADEEKRLVDLVVKVYPNGVLSKYLERLPIGKAVRVSGPGGRFRYFSNMAPTVLLVAGGSGITPLYSIVRAALSGASDEARVILLYANTREEDILLRAELDALQRSSERFTVAYALTQPPRGWKGHAGRIDEECIANHLPQDKNDAVCLVCGPPSMASAMKDILQDQGVREEQIVIFGAEGVSQSGEMDEYEVTESASSFSAGLPLYTMDEVELHSARDDCWLVYRGKVYDVSKFVRKHPGGVAILGGAGKNATHAFDKVGHSERARDIMESYLIGAVQR